MKDVIKVYNKFKESTKYPDIDDVVNMFTLLSVLDNQNMKCSDEEILTIFNVCKRLRADIDTEYSFEDICVSIYQNYLYYGNDEIDYIKVDENYDSVMFTVDGELYKERYED